MSAGTEENLKARIAALEHQIRELRSRLAVLERERLPRAENPTDQAVIRRKVQYDWQS
jgi:chaperonin cofactor prefoldin